MGWTVDQQKAINAPVGDILVTAAAGSGKTAVMVERIINRILADNGTDVDRMLIVTFTNAAASEIKDRIMKAIIDKMDKGENKNLEKQLVLINSASICTIHSFCLEVIRSNFDKINLDPNFAIGDENDLEILFNDCIDSVFEKYYQSEDRDFLTAVRCYSSRSDESFANIIKNLYKFSRSIPNSEDWLLSQPCFDKDFALEVLLNLAKSKANKAMSNYNEIIKICNTDKVMNAKIDFFAVESAQFDGLLYAKNWDDAYSVIKDLSYETLRFPKDCDEYIKEKIKDLRESAKANIKFIKENYITCDSHGIDSQLEFISKTVKVMCRLAYEVGEEFAMAKKEKNVVDFSDIEHMCLKILNDNGVQSETGKTVMNKFDEIYIDEYQDCNSVQEAIFGFVSGKNKGKPNVFAVGDMKQSIYKFRDANPKLFKFKSDTYNVYSDDTHQQYSKILLNVNFRSSDKVINNINSVFRQLMSVGAGELDYTSDEYLYCGSNCYTDTNKDKLSTEVVFVSTDVSQVQDDGDNDEVMEFTKETAEASFIAGRINEMINDPSYVVYDKKLGTYRHIEYRDIVILMRGIKSNASAFADVFKQLNIPLFVDVSGYFDSPEIDFIINVLKVIDNPLDDISLVSVMHHPVFSFTDNELMQIRNNMHKGLFYYAVCEYAKKDDVTGIKCKKFISLITNLFNKSKYMSVNELIQNVVAKTDYMIYLSTLDNSDIAKSNVRMLYTKASDFEANNFKGIFNFVNYVEKTKSKGKDSDSAKLIDENDNVVRVMTIHKSKGLEFPVVFVARTSTKFNKRDLSEAVLKHKDYGIGINVTDYSRRISYPSVYKNAMRYSLEREYVSEEMRILYVALTRAREKLIVVGYHNDYKKLLDDTQKKLTGQGDIIDADVVLTANSYLEWMVMATIRNKTTGFECDDNIYNVDDGSVFLYKSVYADDLSQTIDNTNDNKAIKFDTSFKDDNITDLITYEYPYSLMCSIPGNVSVTELKKMAMENEGTFSKYHFKSLDVPMFKKQNDKLTGAKMGTLMHFVMEKTDFTQNDINQINNNLTSLYESGYISKQELDAVDANDILKFINSPLGKRVVENYDKFYREYSFKYMMKANEIYEGSFDDEIIVQGIIDAFFIDKDGKIVLIDYKTDKIVENEQKTAQKYREQLKYYSIAIEKILKIPVKEAYIYLFETGNAIKI